MMMGEDDDPCLCDPCECNCDLPPQGQPRGSYKKPSFGTGDEYEGEDAEDDGGLCTCNPCECETPPVSPEKEEEVAIPEEAEEVTSVGNAFQLDEFMRAKAFFLNTSTKSGISLYDHLSEVIRKLLDERAPDNPVDYFEEVSMNVKRYRYQGGKDVLQDVFYISEPVLNDAKFLTENWKKYSKWSEESKETDGEGGGGFIGGSFKNLLRLQYYLDQVCIGLPREEMFRLALAIKDLTQNRPFISRARLWGKIFGTQKNYYVVEAELKSPGGGDADLWKPAGDEEAGDEPLPNDSAMNPSDEKVPGAQNTLERAGNVVLDMEFLSAYSKTSGLPPDKQELLLPKNQALALPPNPTEMLGEDGPAAPIQFENKEGMSDAAKWQSYQQELMTKFPGAGGDEEEPEVPPEENGKGVNRRAFYVCNELGSEWTLLPSVTPKQVNGSRAIRWCLTGDLNSNIRTYPIYPGKEGHFLKALLARAAAGSLVSPKGFYKAGKFGGEYEGEDDEDEEDDEAEESSPKGNDEVYPMKKYSASMGALTDPKLTAWVHHAAYILPQGRNTWISNRPKTAKARKEEYSEDESDEDTEFEGEGDEGQEVGAGDRETGPALFSPISNDSYRDGTQPWTLITSSSVFTEFQVASVRSNVWPGSAVICTNKGKVDNIYVGDGLKFQDRCFAPPVTSSTMSEYRFGPEVEECQDPSVDEEQKWLNRLELNQIADVEAKFVDNEEGDEESYDEEESDDYEDD